MEEKVYWGLVYSLRELVHDHHGSRQAGMALEIMAMRQNWRKGWRDRWLEVGVGLWGDLTGNGLGF